MGLGGSLISAGIGAGSAIASSVINAKGARRVARENREFQLDASSTAYQRATVDLEASGLNRILALGGPSSTPSGSVAQPPDFSTVGPSAIAGFRAGQEARLLKQELRNKKAVKVKDATQSESNIQQAELFRALQFKAKMDANLASTTAFGMQSQIRLRNVQAALLEYDVNAAKQKSVIDGSPAGRGMGWIRRAMGSMIGK